MTTAQLPYIHNLVCYSGDDFAVTIEAEPGTASPVNFAGATAKMSIKSRPADDEGDALLVLTSTPAAGLSFPGAGEIHIQLTDTQTAALPNAALYYDIQVTSSGGAVRTYTRGQLIVKPDVTR